MKFAERRKLGIGVILSLSLLSPAVARFARHDTRYGAAPITVAQRAEEIPLAIPVAPLAGTVPIAPNRGSAPAMPRYRMMPIVRGRPVVSAPFQAEIYSPFTGYTAAERVGRQPWELAHRCGGSLIAEGWVLTAAHCINQIRIDNHYRVRLGATDLSTGGGVSYLIDRFVSHADYDDRRHLNDIALLHIVADDQTHPDPIARIASIPLLGQRADDPVLIEQGELQALIAAPVRVVTRMIGGDPVEERQTYEVMGWGKTAAGPDGSYSARLLSVGVDLVAPAACRRAPGYAASITPHVLCAARPGHDACSGDSGGPLIVHRVLAGTGNDHSAGQVFQIGVVSWGKGCAQRRAPGVYMRVSSYDGWIDRAMQAPATVSSIR